MRLLRTDPRARETAEREPEVVGRAGEAPDENSAGHAGHPVFRHPRAAEPAHPAEDLRRDVSRRGRGRGVGPPRRAAGEKNRGRRERERAPHAVSSQKRLKTYHWAGYARIVRSIDATKRASAAVTAASPSSPRAFGTRIASSTIVRYRPSSSCRTKTGKIGAPETCARRNGPMGNEAVFPKNGMLRPVPETSRSPWIATHVFSSSALRTGRNAKGDVSIGRPRTPRIRRASSRCRSMTGEGSGT